MWVSAAELWADQTCDRVTSHSANLQLLAGFTRDWGGSVVRGGGHGHGVLLEGGEVGRSYIRCFVFRDRNDGASLTWARLLCLEMRFECASAAPHLKLRHVWKRQKSRLLQFDPSSSDLLSSVCSDLTVVVPLSSQQRALLHCCTSSCDVFGLSHFLEYKTLFFFFCDFPVSICSQQLHEFLAKPVEKFEHTARMKPNTHMHTDTLTFVLNEDIKGAGASGGFWGSFGHWQQHVLWEDNRRWRRTKPASSRAERPQLSATLALSLHVSHTAGDGGPASRPPPRATKGWAPLLSARPRPCQEKEWDRVRERPRRSIKNVLEWERVA